LYSPLRFFEVTPVGRILNRFSKDIESIDNNVMECVTFFTDRLVAIVTIIAVVGAVTPAFLIGIGPIILVFWWISRLYLNSSRELKRLESVSRSPIYAQFSETLNGVATIRAYGEEKRFFEMNEQKVDSNNESFFYIWAANRWLCLRTDCISAVIVFGAGSLVLYSGVGSGLAAMSITYAFDFSSALLWTVRLHAEMEMAMNSVERVMEYTEIEQEPPAIMENNRPPQNWPENGVVEVRNLSIRYAKELPDVLQNVSFEIQSHEKVAVVGRTGAGKSTLSLAFFRILPLSSGSITIDGVDISQIGLYDLRSRLTIIPQDPVLFNGTLRSNLDPMGEHADEELWDSLNRVNLLSSFQTSAENSTQADVTLEYPVTENGGNFSQGQRQLICLARALLRKTRLIFLDEATASVDNETDARIQTAIRQEFVEGTVITIAHRLRTIIDYDKVLVLEKGRVIEYGSPLDLIQRSPVGVFKSMCEETGEFEELIELAKKGFGQ
jgi:ABC-type multidrug transport system fused ATPase/permease subunit